MIESEGEFSVADICDFETALASLLVVICFWNTTLVSESSTSNVGKGPSSLLDLEAFEFALDSSPKIGPAIRKVEKIVHVAKIFKK